MNGNNVKKKTENRDPYITYLKTLHVIPVSYFILLCIWLFAGWHIILNPYNKNVMGINFISYGMFILFGFILFNLESNLHRNRDNRKLTYIL